MTEPKPQTPRPTIPLWLRLTFFASLALNLLVVGVVVGAMATWGGKWAAHGAPHAGHPGGPLTSALEPDDRRAIGRAMRAARREGNEGRPVLRAEMEGLLAALRAPAFERTEVQARMTALQGQFAQRMALGQTVLLDRLAQMSTAERVAYADRVEEALRKRQKRR